MTGKQTAAEPPLKLDNQICFAIYSAAHAFNRVYKPLLDRLGLTYPQYLVMLVLWESEPLSVTALGQRLFLDSGTLTPLLKRLEAGGFITRRRNPRDERQVLIGLTPAGSALKAQASDIPEAICRASGGDVGWMGELQHALQVLRGRLAAASAEREIVEAD